MEPDAEPSALTLFLYEGPDNPDLEIEYFATTIDRQAHMQGGQLDLFDNGY